MRTVMRTVFGNAFENVVVCPDCSCDLSGLVQRDSTGQPFFTAWCECGETTVSCFDLVFEDEQ
jgi:hypothetical protein